MQSGNVWGITDPGRRRKNNEDAWVADAGIGFAAVADGMGGEACGEVASAVTLQVLYSHVAHAGPDAPPAVLVEGAREANASVRSETAFRPDCNGMGSTLVAALWRKPTLHVANVGDSRCYLFRKRALIQLSYDQNLGNEMRDEMGWSDEQVANFPQKSVLTSAIGSAPEIPVRETSIGLLPGDFVLLCSDGLYGPLGDEGIVTVLRQGLPPLETLTALVDAANAAGGPDNITVVLMGDFF